jgi:hypothetical protein
MAGFSHRGASSNQPQDPGTWAACVEGSGMGMNALPFVSSSHAKRGYQTPPWQRDALSRVLVSGGARERHAPWLV